MHTNYKCTLFQFNNPIPFLKNVSRNKRWENESKIYHKSIQAQSSQKPGVERVLKLINSRSFISSPEMLKLRGLLRETHNLEPQSTEASSTFHPLNFHRFSMINSSSYIHSIWLSHVRQECHSELFHGAAASTTPSSTRPVLCNF